MRITNFIIVLLIIQSCHVGTKEPTVVIDKPKEMINESIKPFANPALVYGSSFGHYFQTLYRNNQYAMMLRFTSDKTKLKFGAQSLTMFYQNKFKFDFELGSLSNISIQHDTVTLTYSKTNQFATRRKITIQCVIENDSTKLLLDELISNPFH